MGKRQGIRNIYQGSAIFRREKRKASGDGQKEEINDHGAGMNII